MKRITILSLLMLVAMLTFAQRSQKQPMATLTKQATTVSNRIQGIERTANTSKQNKIRKAEGDELVTPPTGITPEAWEYKAGSWYYYGDNGWADGTSQANTDFEVVIDGNDIYVKGFAKFFPEAWVKGSINGNTVTFAHGQFVGEDEYGPEYLNGQDLNAEEGANLVDIVFNYDADTKTLTMPEENTIMIEADAKESVMSYAFWQNLSLSFATPEDYTTVTPPVGMPTMDLPYTCKDRISGELISTTIKAGINGTNEIYAQGMVPAAPEAWVKGTLNGNEIVFPIQCIGEIDGTNYFMCGYDNGTLVPFTMSFDLASYSGESVDIMLVNPSSKKFNQAEMLTYYTGVLVGERPEATTAPDNLETEALAFSGFGIEGNEISGTVNVGFDGNDVYFQNLISYIEGGWVKGTLNDNMTVTIPSGQFVGVEPESYLPIYVAGFDFIDNETSEITDVTLTYNADFNTFEFVNDLYINGKKNEAYYYDVIQAGATIGVNPDASWIAKEQGYENQQDVTTITLDEGVTGTLAKNEGSNAPKYYENGEALRMYAGNTLTITSADKDICKIVFTMTGDEKQMLLTADRGKYKLNGNKGTWTGMEKEIVFTVPSVSGCQARIQRIDIYYVNYAKTMVEAPADLVTESYFFKGTDTYNNEEESREVLVGFYGENNDEVYIQGLSYYMPESWVKGKLNDNKLTIPGWYLGLFQSIFGTADIILNECVFDYDPATSTFSIDAYTTTDGKYEMDEYADVTITKIIEKAATPANPVIKSYTRGESYDYVSMNIPMVDTEDAPMLPSKLTYTLYSDIDGEVSVINFLTSDYTKIDEDMTEIPYNFSDDWDIYKGGSTIYFNQADRVNWDKIGVVSTYTGGGETHKSELVWFDINEYLGIEDGIVTVNSDNDAIYNLQGVRVNSATQKGIYIKNGKKFIVK